MKYLYSFKLGFVAGVISFLMLVFTFDWFWSLIISIIVAIFSTFVVALTEENNMENKK